MRMWKYIFVIAAFKYTGLDIVDRVGVSIIRPNQSTYVYKSCPKYVQIQRQSSA